MSALQIALLALVAFPLAAFGVSLLLPANAEKRLSALAGGSTALHLIGTLSFVAWWLSAGRPTIDVREAVLYKSDHYEFFLDLYFDGIGATFLCVGALLTFLISVYSRYYLHREQGYKRFFNTILLFYFGFCSTILSGNFETLFVGWEVLGISSFLLIAFYRDRYLPVKNAVKVFSVYRVADIGLVLVMWLSHHMWKANITFSSFASDEYVHELVSHHSGVALAIAGLLILAAMAKSAMFPFSPWLPRAMEGPTPSSAIFYGSLSVHMGVFLLLRTMPFWDHLWQARVFIAGVGLVSASLAAPAARVQSSIKAQVAYASIAQIGLIFVEIALGLETLALVHFAGNAFLRTYQLLVSPSVVAYLIREQSYHFVPKEHSVEDSVPRRLEYTAYLFALKEWSLEPVMYRWFWNPLKRLGMGLEFMTAQRVALFVLPVLGLGGFLALNREYVPHGAAAWLPLAFALFAFVMMLKAFTERMGVRRTWILIIVGHLWIALAVAFNERVHVDELVMYLSGVLVAGAIGFATILRLRELEGDVNMGRFNGFVARHPKLATVFLLCCLGLAGFPISPTFVGEDLMFTHLHDDQPLLAGIVSLAFIVDGLALVRMYARLYLGPLDGAPSGTAKRSA